jgi:hypothetical protein
MAGICEGLITRTRASDQRHSRANPWCPLSNDGNNYTRLLQCWPRRLTARSTAQRQTSRPLTCHLTLSQRSKTVRLAANTTSHRVRCHTSVYSPSQSWDALIHQYLLHPGSFGDHRPAWKRLLVMAFSFLGGRRNEETVLLSVREYPATWMDVQCKSLRRGCQHRQDRVV